MQSKVNEKGLACSSWRNVGSLSHQLLTEDWLACSSWRNVGSLSHQLLTEDWSLLVLGYKQCI